MKSLANLSQQHVYVIGVSGGPDSMALLDMCRSYGLSFLVAHMNYQKRESAFRDEELVVNYCQRYEIPCYVKGRRNHARETFRHLPEQNVIISITNYLKISW